VDDLGRNRYEGTISLSRSGPFGYTVRAVPAHPLLSSPAELGLATLPVVTEGPVHGDLR
jgi:starch phosphorylase